MRVLTCCSTPYQCIHPQAPESYNKSEYNEKVDVFSFAMIMFELLMYELTYYALQCRDQVSDLVTYVEGVCIDGDRCVGCLRRKDTQI